jgi:ABC-2 type transport system ATP-binding protein
MKVGEQCLYLAQMKGLSKAEAKKQLEYWFERLETRVEQENPRALRNGRKFRFVVCVLHKPNY